MAQYGDYPTIGGSIAIADYFVVVKASDSTTRMVTITELNAIVGNITQSVTGNRTVTTSGTKTETITGDVSVAINTNKYTFAVVAASGNTTELIAGTSSRTITGAATIVFSDTKTETITGNVSEAVNTNKYTRTIAAASGNTAELIAGTSSRTITGAATIVFSSTKTETITGDVSVAVNTNKYTRTIAAASGNTVELIAGTSSRTITGAATIVFSSTKTETITGDVSEAVNTNKYTRTIAAASGNTVELIAGTSSRTITGAATVVFSSTMSQSVAGNRTQTVASTYSHTVTASTGAVNEVIGFDHIRSVGGDTHYSVNTNKYNLDITGTNGNTLLQVAGTYGRTAAGAATETNSSTKTENTTGNRTIAVNTNKYNHNVTASNGNTEEVIAGTYTKGVAGTAVDTYSSTHVISASNYTMSVAGALVLGSTIKTVQPSGTGAGVWKLGKKVVAASVLDAAQYIELDVDGTLYKLCVAQ